MSGLPSYEDVTYEVRGDAAWITINRESVGNAFRGRTLMEMLDGFERAAADHAIRSVVFTGAGNRFFSTGGDVKEYDQRYRGDTIAYRRYLRLIEQVCDAILQCHVPVIARLNGGVVGGANAFHLASDIVVASTNAYIEQIGTRIGSVSGIGPTQWWPAVIGERRARQLLLTGKRIDARTAFDWGAFNALVEPAELDPEVQRWVNDLAQGFPDALRYTRTALNAAKENYRHDMSLAREWLYLHFPSLEATEGIHSFAQKRSPDLAFVLERTQAGESGVAPYGAPRRSCPSCGAAAMPQGFAYCGLCGEPLE